jgi:hypothetical protein
MHRRITFQGDAVAIRSLADELTPLEGVIGLAHVRGGSLKPAGDLLQVDVLNRDADQVLRVASPRLDQPNAELTVVVAQTTAIIDRRHTRSIETDADEAMWEEMESDLRNHGRVSANYVLLMALGGMIAAAAFRLDAISQSIAFVGAAIIAPGFEPIAKVAQALVLHQAKICVRALFSLLVGYAVLFGAAFLASAGLSLVDPGSVHGALAAQPAVKALTHLEAAPLLISACASIAGIVMVVSLRDFYVVGPLMILVLISGVALTGAALALGEGPIALGALRRVAADLILLIVLGAAVFYWKQKSFHRRRPLR